MMIKTIEQQDHCVEQLNRDQLIHTTKYLMKENATLSKRISAVSGIDIAVNQNLSLDEILQAVGKYAHNLIPFEHCSVYLHDKDYIWRLIILHGPAQGINLDEFALMDNIDTVIQTRHPLLIHEVIDSPFITDYPSQIISPLISGHEVIGTLNFATTQTFAYSEDDLDVGSVLAAQLAKVLRNTCYIHELKLVEYELRHYTRELEARNDELDAFTYTIAHDLKSPLTAIRLKTQLMEHLLKGASYEQLGRHIQGTREVIDQMAGMIDQLLWLARTREVEKIVESVEVCAAVNAALCRFADELSNEQIVVKVRDDLPSVMAHKQWVEEIFANLISNAIKYMGPDNTQPRIEIRGWLEENYAYFEVADNGIGIPTSTQPHLFEMFTRVHQIKTDGQGLGLSIVQRIIQRLNGEIGVNSLPGEGSTFWFKLPAA